MTSAPIGAEVEHEEGEHVPAYLAKKQLKIAADDIRQPGDPVPEAASWPNLANYVSAGHIEIVPDAIAKASGLAIASKPDAKPTAEKPDAKPTAEKPDPKTARRG